MRGSAGRGLCEADGDRGALLVAAHPLREAEQGVKRAVCEVQRRLPTIRRSRPPRGRHERGRPRSRRRAPAVSWARSVAITPAARPEPGGLAVVRPVVELVGVPVEVGGEPSGAASRRWQRRVSRCRSTHRSPGRPHTPDVPEACEFDRRALNGRDPTVGVKWEVEIQTMPRLHTFACRAPPTGLEPVTLRYAGMLCHRYAHCASSPRAGDETPAEQCASFALVSSFSGGKMGVMARPPLPLGTYGSHPRVPPR